MFSNMFYLSFKETLWRLIMNFLYNFTLFYHKIISAYILFENELTLFYDINISHELSFWKYFLTESTSLLFKAANEIFKGRSIMSLKQWDFAKKLLFSFDFDHETAHRYVRMNVKWYFKESSSWRCNVNKMWIIFIKSKNIPNNQLLSLNLMILNIRNNLRPHRQP